MIIDRPLPNQIPQLRTLWQEAFRDTDAYLDMFFRLAFSYDRCRCVTLSGEVAAALYWFDCQWQQKRLAYIYAVATLKSQQGHGLCRMLMESTRKYLQQAGYDGMILAPENDALFTMYGKFGYRICSFVQEFSCTAAGEPLPLKPATPEEYAAARRALLPENSVLQEGITLEFLSAYAQLYTGPNLVLAAYPNDEELFVCELLGSPQTAPQVLSTLGFDKGLFRVPGNQLPFTMYQSLTDDSAMPDYFGLALN